MTRNERKGVPIREVSPFRGIFGEWGSTVCINKSFYHSVTVEGLESRVLGRFPDRVSLRSMSLDWIGGQVIFTETTGYQVSSASVRGEGENLTVGSVVSAYLVNGDVVSPSQPRGVLFDETSRFETLFTLLLLLLLLLFLGSCLSKLQNDV